jgi:uncharacterized protein
MANPVVHWEIAANDPGKIRQFYAALFDWSIDADKPGHSQVDTGQGSMEGGIFPCPRGKLGYVTFYVAVDDLEEYLAKAERLGGRKLVPPTPTPNAGTFAMFADPEGNCIGLFKS